MALKFGVIDVKNGGKIFSFPHREGSYYAADIMVVEGMIWDL